MARWIQNKKKQPLRGALCTALVFFLVLALISVLTGHIASDVQRRGQENLERALNSAVVACYAADGAYPESLDALVSRSGLTWNRQNYAIDYRFLGSNIYPDYTILRLK